MSEEITASGTTASGVSLPGQSNSASFRGALAASPTPMVTYCLIGINVLLFLARILGTGSLLHPTAQQLLAWGADFGPLTLHGQWWRLITACFLHFNIIHIAMNMFILLQVGPLTEKLFGNVRFLVAYLLAGVGGNIAGLYIHPLSVAGGASGAVFGVYGMLLGFLIVQRNVVPTTSAWRIARSAGIFIVYNLVYSLKSPEIDMSAHIGGLVTGAVAGGLLARPLSLVGQRAFPARTLTVALCGVAAVYFSLLRLARNSTPLDELTEKLILGNSVTVAANDRVIYSGQATRAEAESLAHALVEAGYFRNPNVAALLSKDTSGTTVSILTGERDAAKPGDGSKPIILSDKRLVPFPWDDPDYLAKVQNTGVAIAPSVGGPPIEIALLNQGGMVEKVVEVNTRKVTIGTNDSVWYSGTATLQDAEALGKALQENGFFRDKGLRVYLSEGIDGADISFMVKDGAWNDPKISAAFQGIGRKVTKSVSDRPVRVHLIDSKLERKKDLPVQ